MKKFIIGTMVVLTALAIMVPAVIVSAQSSGVLAHVAISPDIAIIRTNNAVQFTVVGKDAFNQTVGNVTYTWAVVAGGGNITSDGLFIAGNVTGNFTNTVLVTAVKDDITKTANATVIIAIPGVLDHVIISPVSATISIGRTQHFTAIGKDAFNQTVGNVTYTWAVVVGGGNITSDGLFTAGNVTGNFTNTVLVTAVKDDITKTANTTVTITAIQKGNESRILGWLKGKKIGWHGAATPPGWLKGKKTGWNGENTPPAGKKAK